MRLVSVVTRTRSFFSHAELDLAEQVVDLAGDGPHLDLGIHEPGGPDQLLDDDAPAPSASSYSPGVAET